MPHPPESATAPAQSQVKRKRAKASKTKALKSHELDSSPKAKYMRLRQLVRSLVYENGALCDETARAQRHVLRAQEERRFLLQKLIQLEQLSAAGASPAPLAAAAGTAARSAASAPSSAPATTNGTTKSTPAPAAATATAAGAVRPPGPSATATGSSSARSEAPLAATPGTSGVRSSAPLVAAAVSGRSPAPLAAVPGTSAGRPAAPLAAIPGTSAGRPAAPLAAIPGTSAGRPAAPLAAVPGTSAGRPAAPLAAVAEASSGRSLVPTAATAAAAGSAVLRTSVPLAVAVARGASGRAPTPLAVVTGTSAGRLSAPLVVTPGTSAGRLPAPLVVATGISAARLSAPLAAVTGTIRPSAAGVTAGSPGAQPLVTAVGAIAAHPAAATWRPSPALPSPRAAPAAARRASRPPRRLVSAVPRDASGVVRLPLQLSNLTLQTPGRLLPDRPAYHSASALYPAGFTSLRRFISAVSPRRPCLYRCTVDDAGAYPRFTIAAVALDASPRGEGEPRGDEPAPAFVGRSPDECHRQLLQRVSGALGRPLPAACRVAGEAFFGLTHPAVQQVLQAAAGAAQCGRYRPVVFEVTERPVTVPAELEPGLSGAALWERLGETAE